MTANKPEAGAGRAVLLDRDGVVVEDPGYLRSVDQVRLLPGVAAAIRRLREAGWRVVLVTNQSGIARGYLDEARLAEIHRHLSDLLAAGGAALDGIYFCPHHPEAEVEAYRRACDCRKPGPGMLLTAARDLGLDLRRCWMVGDQSRDVAAGRAAGCKTILVGEGATREGAEADAVPDACAPDLAAAAELLLTAGSRDQCGAR